MGERDVNNVSVIKHHVLSVNFTKLSSSYPGNRGSGIKLPPTVTEANQCMLGMRDYWGWCEVYSVAHHSFIRDPAN